MTSVYIEPGEIRVEGHSGYGKEGEDIVCAGVSALTFALFAAMCECGSFSRVKREIRNGFARVQYLAIPGKQEICEAVILSFRCGIGLLSAEYPKNVKVFEKN